MTSLFEIIRSSEEDRSIKKIEEIEKSVPEADRFDTELFFQRIYVKGYDSQNNPIIDRSIDPNGKGMLQHKLAYYFWWEHTNSRPRNLDTYLNEKFRSGEVTEWY